MSEIRTEDWSGEVGQRWLDHLDQFESMIAPVGEALIAHAAFAPGQRVVDVGCGGGATSLEIAREVAPDGHVIGVDIAPMLIEKAKQRVISSGLPNMVFDCLDAQTGIPPEAPLDRLFSRFGVMFFDNTRAAFANMRSWLHPRGDIVFACWAPPEQNPWMGTIASVVRQHIEMPERDPAGPGPFRLADPDATRAMLEAAGFAGISIELWAGEQCLGGTGATPEQAARFALAAMSVAQRLAEADEALPAIIVEEIADALRPFYRDGSVRMSGAAWFVTARNPG